MTRNSNTLTPEQARDIRARAWRYIFDCYGQHKATKAQNGDIEAGSFAERHARESGRANQWKPEEVIFSTAINPRSESAARRPWQRKLQRKR